MYMYIYIYIFELLVLKIVNCASVFKSIMLPHIMAESMTIMTILIIKANTLF